MVFWVGNVFDGFLDFLVFRIFPYTLFHIISESWFCLLLGLRVFCLFFLLILFSGLLSAFAIVLFNFLNIQGLTAMESMFVTNVGGPIQTHTQVPDTDVPIRGFVEPLMVTSWLALRRTPM